MGFFLDKIKKMSTGRLIASGFALVIIVGSLLLMLPICHNDGVELRYIDSLFISTSAVCVTGLVTVDVADTFSVVGRTIVAALIQIGGLGVASVGAGLFLMMGKKVNIKGRNLIRDAMNLDNGAGIVRFVKHILATTFAFEFLGAFISFFVYIKDYSFIDSVGHSVFHSIAAFNNSGFDLMGSFKSLSDYQNDPLMNAVTAMLIVFGGIGYLVINEMIQKRLRWKRFTLHTKVVLFTTLVLIVSGTLLTKLTENVDWMGALFHSISLRTAGFATYSTGDFTDAGLFISCLFMVIGASPGSTGGGIKTTTLFILMAGIRASATGTREKAFRWSIPKTAFRKAAMISVMMLGVIIGATFLLLVFEPGVTAIQGLFEICSAIGTVGLSTGITPGLCSASKVLICFVMYFGRLGPLTIASLWNHSLGERVRYAEGEISIG